MPQFTESKNLPYAAHKIYELVMDIEKYPQFLPWCKQAKIIETISATNLTADLLINFKNFFEKYRSDVQHGKLDAEHGFFVETKAIDGPFKNLYNKWRITAIDAHSCRVEFFIEFQFNSFFLEKMLGSIFAKATEKMMNAFEERAREIC